MHWCRKETSFLKFHLKKVCRSGKSQTYNHGQRAPPGRHGTHQVSCDGTPDAAERANDSTYSLFHGSDRSPPLEISVLVNGVPLNMEVDTGATKSIISEQTYRRLWPDGRAPPLAKPSARLKMYTGQTINVQGAIMVDVSYDTQESSSC